MRGCTIFFTKKTITTPTKKPPETGDPVHPEVGGVVGDEEIQNHQEAQNHEHDRAPRFRFFRGAVGFKATAQGAQFDVFRAPARPVHILIGHVPTS